MSDTGRPVPVCEPSALGSPYIPVDSWVYSAVFRLYGLGYIDTVFLNMRPWTRVQSRPYARTGRRTHRRRAGHPQPNFGRGAADLRSSRTRASPRYAGPLSAFKGTHALSQSIRPLSASPALRFTTAFISARRSLTTTVVPIENGFNNYTGISGYASVGRFVVYVRSEFQAAPSASGYSTALAQHSPESIS